MLGVICNFADGRKGLQSIAKYLNYASRDRSQEKKFSYEIFENRQKQCYIITFTTATDTILGPFFGDF